MNLITLGKNKEGVLQCQCGEIARRVKNNDIME
jgi:hypothetical protein